MQANVNRIFRLLDASPEIYHFCFECVYTYLVQWVMNSCWVMVCLLVRLHTASIVWCKSDTDNDSRAFFKISRLARHINSNYKYKGISLFWFVIKSIAAPSERKSKEKLMHKYEKWFNFVDSWESSCHIFLFFFVHSSCFVLSKSCYFVSNAQSIIGTRKKEIVCTARKTLKTVS